MSYPTTCKFFELLHCLTDGISKFGKSPFECLITKIVNKRGQEGMFNYSSSQRLTLETLCIDNYCFLL